MLRLFLFGTLADIVHAHGHFAAHLRNSGGISVDKLAVLHADAKGFSGIKGVGIGGKVDEFPIVLRLLMLDAILDVLCRELPAGVFLAVRDDHAQNVCRTLFFGHVRELLPDGVHCDADGIVQGRASGAFVLAHEVIMELSEIGGLDEADGFIVELIEVEHGFARLFALFVQKSVEAALDVILNAGHGPGGVQDDEDVRVVLFHVRFLLI